MIYRYYTGIGSRSIPPYMFPYAINIGRYLANKGFILRSGHAGGSDYLFERGCDIENGMKEIYLPWKGFNGSNSNLIVEDPKAFKIAERYHPNWKRLSRPARLLMARNSHQVLGQDLETPTNFIVCWTEGGKHIGGTRQAIDIGIDYNIPIFNLGLYNQDNLDVMMIELKSFFRNNNVMEMV